MVAPVTCGVVVCDNPDCSEHGKRKLLTPGAGALACKCNRILHPPEFIEVSWLSQPDPPTHQPVKANG